MNVWTHSVETSFVEDDYNFEVITEEMMKISVSCDVVSLLHRPERQGRQANPKGWYQST